ncbi:MAG: hypothetical protein HZA20_12810 [Nitrospirae bacterium]|nr:hypothetical protein [Nitrospirota bacterium]
MDVDDAVVVTVVTVCPPPAPIATCTVPVLPPAVAVIVTVPILVAEAVNVTAARPDDVVAELADRLPKLLSSIENATCVPFAIALLLASTTVADMAEVALFVTVVGLAVKVILATVEERPPPPPAADGDVVFPQEDINDTTENTMNTLSTPLMSRLIIMAIIL